MRPPLVVECCGKNESTMEALANQRQARRRYPQRTRGSGDIARCCRADARTAEGTAQGACHVNATPPGLRGHVCTGSVRVRTIEARGAGRRPMPCGWGNAVGLAPNYCLPMAGWRLADSGSVEASCSSSRSYRPSTISALWLAAT